MYKPDDNNIDHLSRDAAEHYHPPGQPAWDDLQQILDKELPQEKEKKRRGFFFFFLLLGLSVAGTGVWYGLNKTGHKNNTIITGNKINIDNNSNKTAAVQPLATKNSSAEKNEAATANATTTRGANDPSTKANEPPENATDAATVDIKKKTVNDIVPEATTNSQLKNNNRLVAVTSPSLHKANKKIIAYPNFNDTNKKTGNQITAGTGIVKASTHKNTGSKIVPNKIKTKQPVNKTTADIAANNNAADNITDNTPTTEKAGNNNQPNTAVQDTTAKKTATVKPVIVDSSVAKTEKKDSVIAAKKKPKSKNGKAINIGITAGLDLSTVKLTHADNVGYNIGLTGGYQFSSHWSVYTGVIYTQKNYKMNGSDYHPPKHYWTQYVDLNSVEGYCRMWEVPLLARYTFNPKAKTAFFASAGLSSYFMKKQHYDYSFKSMGVPGQASWNNDSTFNHVFSILSLSGGFEKRIGKNMNWQVEPYVKIPLSGVGFGNIRLSSFGINFTVQYRQPVKR